jgi:hypothetical protein
MAVVLYHKTYLRKKPFISTTSIITIIIDTMKNRRTDENTDHSYLGRGEERRRFRSHTRSRSLARANTVTGSSQRWKERGERGERTWSIAWAKTGSERA